MRPPLTFANVPVNGMGLGGFTWSMFVAIGCGQSLAIVENPDENARKRIRAAADIADVRLHDLRQAFGSYASQSGANAFLVRDLLRHRDLSMTGHYVNRADDLPRTLCEMVGEQIAAAMAGRRPTWCRLSAGRKLSSEGANVWRWQ